MAEIVPLTWDDLLPPGYQQTVDDANALRARLDALPVDSVEAFRNISEQQTLREKMADGELTADGLTDDEKALLAIDYRDRFPKAASLADEFAGLTKHVERLFNTPNSGLDGKTVRMPGYVLPLEFDGTETVEFLLVPYVGACIHVPPPPPNQMIYVRFPKGFANPGLYAPVYVTGRMTAIGSTVDLYLSDGERPVETGYSLKATIIEPYKE